jgi:hypothetical protein
MIQIALLARKLAKSEGRRESSFEDMDRAYDEIKRSRNPNRPNGGRLTRRTRGGDENYVVPKQIMPANENVDPLLKAKASLQPASLRILKPLQRTTSEVEERRRTLTRTPTSTAVYGLARRKTRRHRK